MAILSLDWTNDSLQKWNLSSVLEAMPAVPHLPGIQSLGFREHCMVDDVVSILREVIRGKANDGFMASEINLVVGSQDVLKALTKWTTRRKPNCSKNERSTWVRYVHY